MPIEDNSAEIFELNDARRRLRSGEIEPGGFAHVGAYLSAIREDANMTVDEISALTHIKPNFIEAIETNNADALPSRPFALGFVKGYAEALGLDPAPIVARYKTDAGFERAADMDQAKQTQVAPKTEPTERADMSLIAVLAVLVFILWCGWQITRPRDVATPYKFDTGPQIASLVQSGPAGASDGAATDGVPSQGVPAPALPDFFEALPITRVDPVFPVRCEAGAAPQEQVEVVFTVNVDGRVAGERVANSTNACFNRSALNAIRRWQFEPRTLDGIPRAAFDQRVKFPFNRPH